MKISLAVIGGVLGLFLLGCGSRTPSLKILPDDASMYPGYKGNASRTGYTEADESAELSPLWKIKFRRPLFYQPSMAGNYLFQPGTDKKIHVIDINTGAEIAEIKLRRHVGATPELSGSYMAICEEGENSELIVINYIDGDFIWSAKTYRVCLPPVFFNNKIFWLDGKNKLNAARLDNGEKLWSVRVKGGSDSGPLIGNDHLYLASRDSSIYCLDTESGKTIWRAAGLGRTNASPACFGSELYICNADGRVVCYDAISGELLWHRQDDTRLFYSPSVDEASVYYGTGDGRFVKLDRQTGQKLWEFQAGSPIRGTALINSRSAIFASLDYTVYVLDKENGQPLTSYVAGGMISAAPVLFDSKLFIAAQDKILKCFSLKGEE